MSVIDLLVALGNLAVFALTVLVAVVVLLQAVSRFLVARIDIAAFDGPKDDQAVAGMSEIVRSELVRLTDEGAGMSLFLLNGPDKPIDLPADINTTKLGLLAQVISWLPGRVTTVTARVHPEGRHGRGVTVTLKGGWNRASASATIWEQEIGVKQEFGVKQTAKGTDTSIDDAERYHRLAIASAAWVAYRLIERQSARVRVSLLTQDWLSYALFLMATRMATFGADADTVRPVYQAALGRDPRNRGALFGLGMLYANEHAGLAATRLFDACAKEVEAAYVEEDEWRRDRLWYRAKLNGAIVRLNEIALREDGRTNPTPGAALPGSIPNDQLLRLAQDDLTKVADDAQRTITELVGTTAPAGHDRYADLVRFLVNARDYAAVAFQATVG